MPPDLTTSKIQPDHLDRLALIYVRQSTLLQVRCHTGSTRRQYDLVARALALGWERDRIRVVDQDQGQSGASALGRDGFQWLGAEGGLGHAGAVLSLEASRLARSCSDWYRLLEICAVTHTLVIDEEGVYDPHDYTDRLLLGFKGAMSEAELHWLRQRIYGGTIVKAQQGTLWFRLTIGLVHDEAGQIVLDPDEQIQNAVRLIFALFAQLGSAMAVLRHFSTHGLLFPRHCWDHGHHGETVWEPLQHGRVLKILHNPLCAGAYVFGRTRHPQRQGHATSVPKGRRTQLKLADWPIVRKDAHVGYISWEQFLRNQQTLDANRTFSFEERSGAARAGAALLQGIAICGKCGRRMQGGYRADGQTPGYECNVAHLHLGVNRCQSFRGDGIDAAVAAVFLEAMVPAQSTLHRTGQNAPPTYRDSGGAHYCAGCRMAEGAAACLHKDIALCQISHRKPVKRGAGDFASGILQALTVLHAIAEPHRREILRLVRDAELSSGDIAAHFDVTRPAISQHLQVLVAAGLVSMRRQGS